MAAYPNPFTPYPGMRPPGQSDIMGGFGGSLMGGAPNRAGMAGVMDAGGSFGSPTDPFGGPPAGMKGVQATGGGSGDPMNPTGGTGGRMASLIDLFQQQQQGGGLAPTHYSLSPSTDPGAAGDPYTKNAAPVNLTGFPSGAVADGPPPVLPPGQVPTGGLPSGFSPTEGSFGFGSTNPNAVDPRFPNGTASAWENWASGQASPGGGGGAPKSGGPGTTPSSGGGFPTGGTNTGTGNGPFGRPQPGDPGYNGGPNGYGGSNTPGGTGTGTGTGNPFVRPGATSGPPPGTPGANFNFDTNGFGSWGQFLLNPQLQSGFSDALKAAQARFNDPNGQTYYSGPTVAGLTGNENDASNMIRNLAMNGSNGTVGSADNSFQNLTNLGNGGTDPQLEASIKAMRASALQDFQGAGGPMADIRSQALGDGAYGGSRQAIAEGTAMGRLGTALAGNEANMRLQNLTSNRDRAASLVSQTGNLVNANMTPAMALSATGAQQRGINQAQLDSDLNAWKYNTTQPDVRLQNLYGALGGSLPLGGTNVNQQTMPGWMTAALQSSTNGAPGNNLGSIAALLGALGGFSSFFK
jgi:hypothetical protein